MPKKSGVKYFKKGKSTKDNPITSVISTFKQTAYDTVDNFTHKQAKTIEDNIKTVIKRQLYNWPELSPKYKEYKEKHGLHPGILMATTEYVESIKVRPIMRQKKRVGWSVGPPDRIHSESGINMIQLSKWLEFGTSKMPAREHIRPVWAKFLIDTKQTKKELVKNLKKNIGVK